MSEKCGTNGYLTPEGRRSHLPIEEMEVFEKFESVSDWFWTEVKSWGPFEKDTMGKQLVRAADSVGSNLVEGDGRYSDKDSIHFFVIARASARETRLWLRRSAKRGLVSQDAARAQIEVLNDGGRMLNALIRAKRHKISALSVQECSKQYSPTETDPLTTP